MDSDDKKITQLARVTSLSDSDLFVVVVNVGTAPETKAIEKGDAITGGGGLTITSASVTTSNVTGVEGTLHNLDVSGMTANRDFNLPTPSAANMLCGVRLSAGDATYALLIKRNTVEWSRVFITDEIVIFISTGTGAGDWAVYHDGRIPQVAQMKSTSAQTLTTATITQLTFNTEVYDVGDVADISTEKFTVRRASKYNLFGTFNIPSASAKRALLLIYQNGAGITVASLHGSVSANLAPVAEAQPSAAVGDYFELHGFQDTGSNQDTSVANESSYPRFTIKEILQ